MNTGLGKAGRDFSFSFPQLQIGQSSSLGAAASWRFVPAHEPARALAPHPARRDGTHSEDTPSCGHRACPPLR